MAQTASPSDKTSKPAARTDLVPPDERFWERYSPHAEFPLSSAGSLALHILLLGVLLLAYFLSTVLGLFSHSSQSLPVEAVRLDLGGGGGNPHGIGDGPNKGPAPQEVGGPQQEGIEDVPPEDIKPQQLDVKPGPQVKPQFDPEATRFLTETGGRSAKAFQDLSDVTSKLRVPDRKPSGSGQGGTGSGGGSGGGQGTGVGDGQGPGKGTLTQREKRMLRWSMLFNTNSGENYVAQLRGLGAILAIPVREKDGVRDYKIVRDLSARHARLLTEDISKIQRIYWIDNTPQSVRDVLTVLGIRLKKLPSHFVAFMPEELEQKLHSLEKAYLEKQYPTHTEDSITETKFRINVRGGKYEPEVTELKVK
ncbi:MAG TPA: hypothetical protein VMG10_32125 [Gemmataceae bacterium]|nr:hypothetical protein [Gemmataceae bacterium]